MPIMGPRLSSTLTLRPCVGKHLARTSWIRALCIPSQSLTTCKIQPHLFTRLVFDVMTTGENGCAQGDRQRMYSIAKQWS